MSNANKEFLLLFLLPFLLLMAAVTYVQMTAVDRGHCLVSKDLTYHQYYWHGWNVRNEWHSGCVKWSNEQ